MELLLLSFVIVVLPLSFVCCFQGNSQCHSHFSVHVLTAFFTARIYIPVYCPTLLTPWSTVRLEKLTGFQLVKKFPTLHGTRRFVTAFTSAHHLSLS